MRITVTGAGGFIGTHLVRRLKTDGHWVRGADIKRPEWSESSADEFLLADLRQFDNADQATKGVNWVFALAANMGGMGHISKAHAEIIRDNTLININTIEAARANGVKRYLFTSSACIYNVLLQTSGQSGVLREDDAYPAWPQGAYGWEKLHAEHIAKWYSEAGWLDTRIPRLHNCYGPEGAWEGGREKVPAALCRKIAVAKLMGNSEIEIWGDGKQTRSYMYVDDCVEGLIRLMHSDYSNPLNVGSDYALTVNELADLIAQVAGIEIVKKHILGPEGVRKRNSDNALCEETLGWVPSVPLWEGLEMTYRWIEQQVQRAEEQGNGSKN